MNNKKKLLIGSLSTAAVVAGVAMTGGTSAYFYDLETSDGNLLGACSLDLVASGAPDIQQTAGSAADITVSSVVDAAGTTDGPGTSWDGPMVGGLYQVGIGAMEPGDMFTVTIPLDNAGKCAGELFGDIRGPFNDLEGSNYEPETAWEAAGNNPDKPSGADDESAAIIAQQPGSGLTPAIIDQYDGGDGDLDNVVLVDYGPDDASNVVANETFAEFAWRKPTILDPSFTPTETKSIVVQLRVPDSGVPGDGNEIMGDSFEFLIDFALAQPGKINPNTAANLNDPSTIQGPVTP